MGKLLGLAGNISDQLKEALSDLPGLLVSALLIGCWWHGHWTATPLKS
jgi:hypothetical protein